ncbi:hypothetical protein Ancab_033184 [Ancistrocladus abbreviatus]
MHPNQRLYPRVLGASQWHTKARKRLDLACQTGIGKWLGSAFTGDEAEVLAPICSLEERDKAGRGQPKFVHPIADEGDLQGKTDSCKEDSKVLDLQEESLGLTDEEIGKRKALFAQVDQLLSMQVLAL